MKRNRLIAIVGAGIAVAAVAAVGVMQLATPVVRDRTRPDLVPRDIPAVWRDRRASPGHVAHVNEHNVKCSECHGAAPTKVDRPPMTVCARCHEAQTAHAHRGTQTARTDCLTCHAFRGGTASRDPWICVECHVAPAASAHPAAAPANLRARNVAPSLVSTASKIAIHRDQRCADCHRPHADPSVAARECTECHREIAAQHGASTGAALCQTCHEGHHTAEERVACASCHTTGEHAVPVARIPDAHGDCTSCHAAHDFRPASVRPCASCHTTVHVLGEARVPAHRDCVNCHGAHDVVPSSDRVCTTCHARVQSSHPQTRGQTCIGCHAIHGPPRGSRPVPPTATHVSSLPVAAACTSCHADARAVPFHAARAPCTGCHQPHAFTPAAAPGLCTQCHATQSRLASSNNGHAQCQSCHSGTTHRLTGPTACATCHGAERASAPQGHQECTSCHEPHGGAVQRTCASCHTQQASHMHGRVACTNCHRPHGPAGPATPPPCASCHRPQTGGPHANVRGACAACHQPHGPVGSAARIVCTSCHARPSLPGLHQQAQHAECTTCHGAHLAQPRADRATCTSSCHTAQVNHQPDARRCSGCHTFRN